MKTIKSIMYRVIGAPITVFCAALYIVVKLTKAVVKKGLKSGIKSFIAKDMDNFYSRLAQWDIKKEFKETVQRDEQCDSWRNYY